VVSLAHLIPRGGGSESHLERAGVAVLTVGDLIDRLLDDEPAVVVAAAEHLSRRWTRPTLAPPEILDLLAAHPSMRRAADRLRDLID